jgi:outer membrane protein TolC
VKRSIKISFLVGIMCISLISFTAAETNIVDSMDFQGEEKSLTLEEAIEVMLKDNPAIEQAKLNLEKAKVESEKIENNADDLKDAKEYTMDDMGNLIPVGKMFDKYKVKGSLDNLKVVKLPELQANFTLSNAQRNYDATVESLKANIEEAYFGLLQAQDLAEINKANMDIAKDLYDKTKKKFDLGLVAKQEVLNSELSYIKAQNEYKSSLDTVKKAKMALNTQLGYDVMTNIKLQDELTYKEFEVPSIAEAVSKALENRNEIKAAEFNYQVAQINMDIIAKQYPEITYMYREQKVELEKAEKDLQTARKNIEMEVRSNYLDVLEKQEEIEAGKKSVELAKEALRLNQLSYDVGMAVLTDVQKAQTTLKQAQLGLSKAILDYNLAVLKFEDSIGVGRNSF